MKIVAGDAQIEVKTIIGETRFYEGAARPVLKILLEGGITDEQLQALCENDWRLQEDDGTELPAQADYRVCLEHSLVFVKMGSLEEEILRMAAELRDLQAEKEALEGEVATLKTQESLPAI